MSGYLLLSVTPARRRLLRPFSLADLGHVDVLLWSPPGHPDSYGFYVQPTRLWRVFLSVLWPQAARMVRSRSFPGEPTHWRCWELAEERFAAVRDYLRQVEAGCAGGAVRYRAVRFNCFHLARRCLETAGIAGAPLRRQWLLGVPTLGAASFLRGPLRGTERTPMGPEPCRRTERPERPTAADTAGSTRGNRGSSRERLPVFAFYGIPDPYGRPPGDLHDHGAVLIRDGRVEQFLELERITRQKHDNRLPDCLEELLRGGLLDLPDRFHCVLVDSFCGRRFASAGGRVQVAADGAADGELAEAIEPAAGCFAERQAHCWVCNHELAHLGSLLPFTGGFEEGMLLAHVDGGASRSNVSIWLWQGGRPRRLYASWELQPQTRNFNLNPLSAALLGLPAGANLGVAGSLMGYAAYGQARPELLAWLRRHEWFHGEGAGLPGFRAAAARDHAWRGDFDPHDPFLMDIAACMQSDLLDAVERLLLRFQEETGAESLGLTGGVALNIELNTRLERSGRFRTVRVPPCCNDSGLALGAAALFAVLQGGSIDRHGPFLNSAGLPTYRYAPRFPVAELAARLARGEVIGVCTGAAEAGPRALGHRSLLASPGSTGIRDRVSQTMKRREWYRPVAPIVLRSDADRLFEGAASSPLADFMLGSFRVRPEVRERVPGIVHVDGTARVQVVEESDPELQLVAALLAAVRDAHGIPCLINTSFNRRDEPLVHTHAEALAAAWEMGADAVVLDNELLPHPSPPRAAREE